MASQTSALSGRRMAIVDPTPGITRDLVEVQVSCAGRRFLLVDTGGLGATEDPLAAKVRRLAERALEMADVILFVGDSRTGVTVEDRAVAKRLRKLDKPMMVAANKCDVPALEASSADFETLGLGPVTPVSAVECRGTADLREALAALLPENPGPDVLPAIRIAFLGQRNVGKSTLVNALCGAERVLVDPLAGTTRDAIEVPFRGKGGDFSIVDTAGFRREGRIDHPVELYAAARSREALGHCDVAVLVLDATQPISALDKKIAREIRDASKPTIIAVNKWDLMGEIRTGAYQAHLEDALTGLSFAPVLMLSAKDGRNLKALLHVARALARQSESRVTTAVLNRVLEKALRSIPGPGGPRLPKVFFASQVAVRPPTFSITVNEPALFHPAFRRSLEQQLRKSETLPFREVPLRLIFRPREGRHPRGQKNKD